MSTPLLSPEVSGYLDRLVPVRAPELLAMENAAAQANFPIIGPAAGQFCYLLARLTRARRVFELGSGFGYSTAWFARAVQENGGGVVHHSVWDEGLSRQARRHLEVLGLADLVEFHVGESVDALARIPDTVDLVFNDIDKDAYPASLDAIERRLRSGGVLIVDNALWNGRIFDVSDTSASTTGVRELTRRLASSPHWITGLVPIRDGLLVAHRA